MKSVVVHRLGQRHLARGRAPHAGETLPGCAGGPGRSPGIESASSPSTSIVGPSRSGSSTSAGRCRVTSTKSRASSRVPARARPAGSTSIEQPEEAVDHRVADQLHAVAGDPLGGQVLDRVRGGAEQQVGDAVGEDAVHLLGHLPVARAQARLDVGDGDAQLGRGERRGQGRVDVARRPAPGRRGARAGRLDADEHARPSARRGCRSRPEVGVRLAHAEALDESARRAPGRSAGPCAGARTEIPSAPSSAAITGADLTKFGRAPTTASTEAVTARQASGGSSRNGLR